MTPLEALSRALRGADEHIAVTGATGWFGAVALDLLYAALEGQAPSRVTAYASRARDIVVQDGRTVTVRPLADLVHQSPAPTTVLHFAFLTRDKVAGLGVDAYVSQNLAITAAVLDAVAVHRPRRLVVTSSGAVYGTDRGMAADLRGNPYGTLKRIDELALRQAAHEVGGICVIPRVFSVAGPRMTKPELYALGSMIRMATDGGPVTVQARGPVLRSYCGVDEVVALATVMALGGREVTFDSGGDAVEMVELARVVADVHGLPDGSIRQDRDESVPTNRYVGEPGQMRSLAAGIGMELRPLDALVRSTSEWLTPMP